MPPQYPSGSPQAERVELERVMGSIQAVNTCVPDSGAPAATSGLLNGCSTIASAFSVFVLQTQVVLCWLWAQIQGVLNSITDIDATLVTLQNEIDAIQNNMRTPGAVTISPGSSLGAGGTASVVGNDTAGQVTQRTGTGATTGDLFTLGFTTPYATAGMLHLEIASPLSVGLNTFSTTDINGSLVTQEQGLPDDSDFIFNYVVLGGT